MHSDIRSTCEDANKKEANSEATLFRLFKILLCEPPWHTVMVIFTVGEHIKPEEPWVPYKIKATSGPAREKSLMGLPALTAAEQRYGLSRPLGLVK